MRCFVSMILAALSMFFLFGCVKPKITIFPDTSAPLREHTIEGKAKGKVLVVQVRGFISDSPKKQIVGSKPSAVQEVVSRLNKAKKDNEVKAVLLQVDSPGGTAAASDMLYHELLDFKAETGTKIVAAMMDVAASGGYYISLAADYIMAQPTTVTGSVGVVFIQPKMTGLMGKLGLDVEIAKSGKYKDMGSPFRQSTEEEREIVQGMIDEMAGRFIGLVSGRRKLTQAALAEVAGARVFLGDEAFKLGLVDGVGYLSDAIREVKELAGLPKDAKVVVYRRNEYADDNLYNISTSLAGGGMGLRGLGLLDYAGYMRPGLYYLWLPGAGLE